MMKDMLVGKKKEIHHMSMSGLITKCFKSFPSPIRKEDEERNMRNVTKIYWEEIRTLFSMLLPWKNDRLGM